MTFGDIDTQVISNIANLFPHEKKKRIAILHFKWCNDNASLSDSVSTAFDVKKLDLEVVGILRHFQQHYATHHSGTFGKMTSYLNKNVLSYNFHKFKLLLYFLCTLWVNVLSLCSIFSELKLKGTTIFKTSLTVNF